MSDRLPIRILALDVRPRRFGFVVFEGSNYLLDWGVRSYTGAEKIFDEIARKRIAELLSIFEPSAVAARAFSARNQEATGRVQKVLRIAKGQALLRSISFTQISRQGVLRFFRRQGYTTKQEIATSLAKLYPDLAWKLPPKRRPWQSEDYRMRIFDAAALGATYFDAQEKGVARPSRAVGD